MTKEEILMSQDVCSIFFNEPITEEEVKDILIGIQVNTVIFMGKQASPFGSDASWHTVTTLRQVGLAAVRTALLLTDLKVILISSDNKAYLDVYKK